MRRLMAIACAISILVGSGCASRNVWVRDNTDGAQAQKDFNECKYDSNKSSFVPYGDGRSPISAGFQEGFQGANLMSQCMRAKGYYLVNRHEQEQKNARAKETLESFKTAMKNKNYDEALRIVNNEIFTHPNSGDAYSGKGNVYFVMGKYKDAITNYSKAQSFGYNNTELIIQKSIAFTEIGEFDVAIECVNQRLLTNNEGALYNARAYAFNKKGEYDKALEDSNKAIALDSNAPNHYKNKGLAYMGKGEYEKAIEQFNKAIAINPEYKYAFTGRGNTYLMIGKTENAKADFKKACQYGDNEACSKVQ